MFSRKIVVFSLLISVLVNLHAQEKYEMPVMHISFDGHIVRDMDYVNGKMKLTDTDGTVVELPAKFRTRGATAQDFLMKPSLNMKLRTEDYSEELDSALLGMRSCSSWILDGMAIDRICMRNRVAFDIWNEFSRLPYTTDFDGRNGTEGRFIEMYINDKYYGIYCLGDRINRKLLNLKKTKENEDGSVTIRGALYKSGTLDILNQNEPAFSEDSIACVVEWHNAWELKYPEEYAGSVVWQPLQDAYLKGRNKAYVKKYFYLENLVDYHLFVMALSITDNWGNKNRFFSVRNLSKDINDTDPTEADRRRFVVTPWDLDTSLGGSFNGACYGGNYVEWPVDALAKIAPYPNSEIQNDPDYLNLLKSRWMIGRSGAFSPASVRAKLENYRDLFIKSGAWQRMVNHFDSQNVKPMYVNDLTEEIEYIMTWYINRFQEMDIFFGITDEDGINKVKSEKLKVKSGGEIYDLAGRRAQGARSKGQENRNDSRFSIFNSQLKKGLYIQDQKKVLILQ